MAKLRAKSPAKRRNRFFGWFLIALFGVVVAMTLRQGWLPARFTPLPAVDLSSANNWLVDWRLAELKYERGLCRAVMIGPNVKAKGVADNPLRKGCGWVNAVRLSSAGRAKISVRRLTCEAAAAFALWMSHDVQPLALETFGAKVASIHHLGTYSCRNIIGSKFWRKTRSEHATANAIDVAGFTLMNGTKIDIRKHWKSSGTKARFLRTIHERACRYFRVAIGPEFNKAHHNHFHYDRGPFSRCK